ncbi:MAG TPA: M1 family aminopeptidase [Vicinamibacterales bacterium]
MLTLLMMALAAASLSDSLDRGVSEALARERASAFSAVRYDLAFTLPVNRQEPVEGRLRLTVALAVPGRIVIDFSAPKERVHSVRVGETRVVPGYTEDHLVIPAEATRAGDNRVTIDFVAGDAALNRSDDFLYTLFVPARAHLTFPCFDQPDLKARYTLSLDVPAGWETVANAAEAGREADAGRIRVRFAETKPLPTYLFGFVAGKFAVERATRNGREMRMFHRETDAAKVARNRDVLFDLHASALAWLENYTAIPYPFDKFDFILIPSFQFGGMEHAGAILYNAASLMLDESATQNQLLNRASTIAHETSHMWFGDLVTMRWFNDVWMKEVFANFMAAKIVNPSFPGVNHDLRFLLSNYPDAYSVDRTAGSNPIRQPLTTLDDAGQLYGPIIYEKAPIVMRQLEMIVGEERLRDGLREYLKRYAFGNATWLDLIRILDAKTPDDLAAWSRAWVEERGRPEFTTTVRVAKNSTIQRLTVTMSDPLRRGLVWPQRMRITLGYPGSQKDLAVYANARQTVVREAAGLPKPLFILPNGAGLGYGLFLLDEDSARYLLANMPTVGDALTRGAAWVTLWDNVLEGRVAPGAFIDAAIRALPDESDEQNTQRVLAYVSRAFWRYLPHEERLARAPALEAALRAGIMRAGTASLKSAWFSAFRDDVLTPEGEGFLERVWRRDEKIAGLPFVETDEIVMAMELAVREVPGWQQILQTQLDRTQNPDRKARFAFVMPALSADPQVRASAFERFRQLENRRREPWVSESLAYLNHPLRAADAERFITPGLELLADIQRTGDIFFPSAWTGSMLWGHRSPRAAAMVHDFLAKELQYPERLRWTVLSSADDLFRAAAVSVR